MEKRSNSDLCIKQKWNNMRITGIVIMTLFIAGCGVNNHAKVVAMMGDTTNGIIQMRTINGHKFRLSYLPAEQPVEGDFPEWCFKLNIHLPEGETGRQDEGNQASYGVDTLFHLVSGKDTLLPLHAMRVANGNMKGIEYMIIFNRPDVLHGRQTTFCFSDWLFTHQYLAFPLQVPAIVKIDSLSSRI